MLDFRISADELLRNSRDYLRRHRGTLLLDSSDVLISHVPDVWSSGTGKLNRASIFEAVVGINPSEFTGHDSDTSMMREFVNNSHPDEAVYPGIFPKRKVLPEGIPLLDILRAHSEKIDTWKVPARKYYSHWANSRSVIESDENIIEVREIVIGDTHDVDILQTIDWIQINIRLTQAENPTGTVPLIVKEQSIPYYDILRMANPEVYTESFALSSTLNSCTEEEKKLFVDANGNQIEAWWM